MIQNLILDLDKGNPIDNDSIKHRIGDSTTITATILDYGKPATFTETKGIFKCYMPNGKKLIESCDVNQGTVSYLLSDRFNQHYGNINSAYFEIGSYSTQTFEILILRE